MNDDNNDTLGIAVRLASLDEDLLIIGESDDLLDVETRALPDKEEENEDDPEALLLALFDDEVDTEFDARGDVVALRD